VIVAITITIATVVTIRYKDHTSWDEFNLFIMTHSLGGKTNNFILFKLGNHFSYIVKFVVETGVGNNYFEVGYTYYAITIIITTTVTTL
jgi:hypothetical protein